MRVDLGSWQRIACPLGKALLYRANGLIATDFRDGMTHEVCRLGSFF
jgi:hypothetical protein